MFMHSTAMAIASTVTAGAIAATSLPPLSPSVNFAAGKEGSAQVAAEDIVIHAAVSPQAATAAQPAPSVYDALGHAQATPAQTYCDAHDEMVEGLKHDFAESLTTTTTNSEGLKIELWTSSLMGTWTALHHGSDGISCVVASGVDWSDAVDGQDLIRIAMHEVAYNG
ncbi:hypothetical protein Q9295_15700 [Xinfangfangia sp. CPCC 101601]|uniref:Uncharacterized protein n=1 Tax=Pseudogemmobacter lacusdianii TaxID=3069608 RepID=A0ABU0W1H0_9RHOB|nr:hypothetical protein [Xinfangfangia sp. CPCC 101601]MDQ2067821.1 hypothetical protein [Xinfangfangia sp. CPCC 101601]